MTITIEADYFLSGVKAVLPFTGRAQPIHSTILLEADGDTMSLSATDGWQHAVTLLHAEGKGRMAIPARILSTSLSQMAGAVTIDCDGDWATLVTHAANLRIKVPDVVEFPTLQFAPCSTTLPAGTLDVLADVATAASKDPARPVLGGVTFTGGRAFSTDSNRAHWCDVDAPEAHVPASFIDKAAKLYGDEVLVGADTNMFCIRDDATTIASLLIQGEAPNFVDRFANAEPTNRVTVGSADLLAALSLVGAIQSDAKLARPVRLRTEGDVLIVSRAQDEIGSAEATIPCSGHLDPTAANEVYLADAVNAAGGDEVTIESTDAAMKPLIIRGRASSLFMPVRLK